MVDSGSKNMEISVMKYGEPVDMISEDQIQAVIDEIEKEQEEAKKTSSTGETES